MRILKIGVYLAPFVFLIIDPGIAYPFLATKTAAWLFLMGLLGTAWALLLVFSPSPEYRVKLTSLSKAILIWSAVLFLTALVGVNFSRSLWSSPMRNFGIAAMFASVLYFFILKMPALNVRPRLLLSLFVHVGTLSALWALIQGPTFRPGSFFGNPTYLAMYLLFSVFMALWLLVDNRSRTFTSFHHWILIASIVVQIIAIFFTQTRAAILGLFLGLVVLLLLLMFWNRSYRKTATSALMFLVLLAGAFLLTRQATFWNSIPGLNRVAQTSLQTTEVADRVEAWKLGLEAFKQKPFLGSGAENFKYPFEQLQNPATFQTGDSETFWDKPHNAFLEILIATGLLGALAAAAVLILLLRRLFQKPATSFATFVTAALLAYAVSNFFFFDTLATAVWLALLFALVDNSPPEKEKSNQPQYIVRMVGVALLVLSLFGVVSGFQMRQQGHVLYAARAAMKEGTTEAGIEKLKAVVATWHPHINESRRIFASEVIDARQKGFAILNADTEVIPAVMQQLDTIIENDPNNYLYWFARAYARSVFFPKEDAQLQAARADLENSMELSPQRVQSFYLSAEIYRLQGKTAEAIREANRALELIPQTRDIYFSLLSLYLGAKDVEMARTTLEKAAALQFFPQTEKELEDAAAVWRTLKEFKAGAAYFEAAFNQNPESADTAMRLIYFDALSGNRAKAKSLHDQLVLQLPEAKNTRFYKEYLAGLRL